MSFLLPRGTEPPELPAEVLRHWAELPGAHDVVQFRRGVYLRADRLWETLGGIERSAIAGRGVSLAGLAQLWLWISTIAVVQGRRENTTCSTYARGVAGLLAWTHETGRDFAALDTVDFHDWLKHLALKRGNAIDSRGGKMAAVRSFYHWRFVCGLGADRAQFVPLPTSRKKMARKYSENHLVAMFASVRSRSTHACKVRDKAFLLLLLAAGLRREELSKLDIRDLSLGEQRGVVLVQGKGAKEREVPIEGPVVTALRDWLGVRENLVHNTAPDAVFVCLASAYMGRRLGVNGIEDIVKHHARNAGIRKGEFGVHRFRVNFATALYDDGAGIEEIRILLGHDKIETTRRYLAVSERARKTRLSSQRQNRALGDPRGGQPRWMRAAMGDLANG